MAAAQREPIEPNAFLQHMHGGVVQGWDGVSGVDAAAAGVDAMEVGDGGGAPEEEERRFDEDGELYTREQFVEEYGGTEEWDAARRQPAQP